jgi:hypothetical protein
MLITRVLIVESTFLKGGFNGESGTDEIIFLLEEAGLYYQFPNEFILLTLAMKVSFLDVSANSFLRVVISISHINEFSEY